MPQFNEIRLDHEGQIDDVAIYDFRMERMDDTCWWVGYYRGEERMSFYLIWRGKKAGIEAALSENGLNAAIVPAQAELDKEAEMTERTGA